MTAATPLTAEEIASYEAAVGRRREDTATLDAETVARFSATLGDARFAAGDDVPLGRQWGFFLPVVTPGETGPDGHPRRGGFIPAIRLARRMFAGGRMERLAPLTVGRATTRTTTIESVARKDGRDGGELVFVEIAMTFVQDDTPRLRERQTLVYLNPGPAQQAPAPVAELPGGAIVEDYLPTPVDLFRFSAVTYNGHRIHYDQRYATTVEGYPDLVVHGPLIALKLLDLAQRTAGRDLAGFGFRARRPAFVDQRLRLVAERHGDGFALTAHRCDGQVAMTAEGWLATTA